MGDEFDAGTDPPGDAVTTGAETATMDQLLGLAAALAARAGLGDTSRVLSGRWLLVPGPRPGCWPHWPAAPGRADQQLRPGPVLEAGRRATVPVADALDPAQAAAVRDAGPPPAGTDPSGCGCCSMTDRSSDPMWTTTLFS